MGGKRNHHHQHITEDGIITLLLDLIRDSYEEYDIYNVFILLINYGGGLKSGTHVKADISSVVDSHTNVRIFV